MTDDPKYVVMHGPGIKGVVLERCPYDACYSKYAELDTLFAARDLARRLNKAEAGKRK